MDCATLYTCHRDESQIASLLIAIFLAQQPLQFSGCWEVVSLRQPQSLAETSHI